jgi:hypothetical protein
MTPSTAGTWGSSAPSSRRTSLRDKNVRIVAMQDGKVTESWFFHWSGTFERHFPA